MTISVYMHTLTNGKMFGPSSVAPFLLRTCRTHTNIVIVYNT